MTNKTGPTIGYFISINKLKELKSGDPDSVYKTVMNSAKALGGKVFLFSIDDVDWSSMSVHGYTYSFKNPGALISRLYPFPRVINNRCFGPDSACQITELLSSVRPNSNIIVINRGTLKYGNLAGTPAKPAEILGCPIQVRILVQRDYRGIWQYSAGVISLKAQHTGVNTRGYFRNYPFECGLQEAFPAGFQKVKSDLIKQAVGEAEKIGSDLPDLAELEIRFVVNNQGLGLIKGVHERPLKQYASDFKGSISAYLAVNRPLHYCFKLAGYPLSVEPRPGFEQSDRRPLIGIFEEPWETQDFKLQRAGNYQLLLARASTELGCITYHFSLNELRGTNCIEGWYYDPGQKKWLQKEFPWPQVLYDRATFPYASQREKAKEFRRALKHFGQTMFLNTRSVFGKGYTSDILSKMPILSKYLPFNVENPSPLTVEGMVKRYSSVFIKTEHGSNLQGVLKVTRQNRSYVMSGRYETYTFPSFRELWVTIRSIVKTDPFVAQEGVRAALYQSQPLNVRTIVQKNGTGVWEVTLVKPWIASTPDVRGCPLQWTRTMMDIFSSSDKTASIYSEICNVSLAVCKTLEAHIGSLGELGIDLMIDSSGHPWIIEVNGKTNKIFFLKDEKPGAYYNLYYNPIAYACFLAKTHSQKTL
ncbi:MAG TPA: YheC/YheD family protein [Desulfobacteria bacterium]|nr:YheC/YheD family protein [Desulfobacteria bacterium]